MPPTGIADRHRAERVAVVAAADGEHALAGRGRASAAGELQRDLDRDRPGVGEEHVLQRPGVMATRRWARRTRRLVGRARRT